MGRLNEAHAVFEKAVNLSGGNDPATLAGLGYVLALQGNKDAAKAIIAKLQDLDRNYYIHPLYFAVIYIGLRDYNMALDFLEKGLGERSEWMVFLQVEHMLNPIREDVRFKSIVKKMHF